MISLLAKLLIKDYKNVTDAKVREAYGVLCGGMGIALNILLFLGKFLAGTISGSIAITADAFNNLSDAGSSFITLIGFKLGSQKPDPEHPFGHGRMEYLSGLAVAVLIIVMALELFKSSFDKILHPEVLECSAVIVLILLASIAVKIYMAIYNHNVGKKIHSAAMGATAKDSMSDTIATTVVLISTIVGAIWGIPIDGYCGVLLSILIFMAGIGAIKDTVGPLLGTAPDKEFVERIEEIVMAHDIVKGMHDLVVHDYGPGRVMISLHAEVPHTEDILVIHDEIDNIEEELGDKLNCEAVIHMDPIIMDDEKVNEVKEYVRNIVCQVGEELNFHDFRMVSGNSHTNLIFDVVVPFKYRMSDEVIKKAIQEAIWVNYPRYNAVIHIDHTYC
ncbi:cation diffusion facilitator family transporter [Lacrimispora saccharolytica]|uniref:cation diffusion facilitator family transporter n=1 Tax=Lacrimispora saccharolytica TaxID=84030 RepID=UPI00265C8D82|nr:cation diffusion facilitator family transporter [Lacrimispora saccharolytica]MBS7329752.1 cation transporter [Lachnospiraceae bacterium]MCF2657370.1 cation transporter [Lacrimispora saccharolytica]MDD7547905.1 cation diffusion facilitator family transporter [Lachnospiraceae bacterium]MDY4125974.1 cation diffusion facilitator family transporter [Lachnospiraceae bacterium]